MKNLYQQCLKIEFEARMFISLTIVFIFVMLSLPVFGSGLNNVQLLAVQLGFAPAPWLSISFILIALMFTAASLLRMWSGSLLASPEIMSFKVQKEYLVTAGPFGLVRNPIYLADLIAYLAIPLCLKPIAFAIPVLIFLHYTQLVRYEEQVLANQFGADYKRYCEKVSRRFFPTLSGIKNLLAQPQSIRLNYDGFRNNAQYLLLIPGFIVAAFTGELIHALIIGLPAVLDWAIIHTYKGLGFGKVSKIKGDHKSKHEKLAKSNVFEDVLYAQCWEDPSIDRTAFQIHSDDIVFSITSGGCNVLSFLLDKPKKIIALDLNPSQNYLLELKMLAFQYLKYEEMLAFFGVTDSNKRIEFYQTLRPFLSSAAKKFWEEHQKAIKEGIIHCGRYENYMHLLSKWFTRLMGKQLIEDLFATSSKKERKDLYEKRWNNIRWKIFTRLFLSRPVMSLLFTKSFFIYLEDSFSFGKHFQEIIKRGIIELPPKENYFFSYMILGHYYDLDHLPFYLRKENFETIQRRLGSIELINESCEEYFAKVEDRTISKFNFTNIFEWMPPLAFEKLLQETIRVSKDNAVITYRNLLVPRSRPASLANWLHPQTALAAELHERDLSFIYKAYIVEKVKHPMPNEGIGRRDEIAYNIKT